MSPRYRADIDGLRAIAVVAVVLFHAGAPFATGGYVGVDVFFVISGYLITGIIAPEAETSSFSILRFYNRRIRRIFPALVAVVAFCLIVGMQLLTPKDYQNLGLSVVAAAFFVSNVLFWRQLGYFDTPASEKPLLHTWSLSIEEQFYLLYPAFLIAISKTRKKTRALIIYFVCIASFATSAVLVRFHPSAAFYLAPTRIWELLVGALLAIEAVPRNDSKAQSSVASAVGIGLIFVSVFLYTRLTPFPGTAALAPVLGTGLIIWSGHNTPAFVHRVLSTTPFMILGKSSYSVYLWHFPFLAFASYVSIGPLPGWEASVICAASFVIGIVSWQIIERPFRFPPRNIGIPRMVAGAMCGMALVACAGAAAVAAKGFPNRMDSLSAAYLDAEEDESRHHMECLSLERHIVQPKDACTLGVKTAKPKVLLWGDSHSAVTATALESAASRHHSSFLFAASVDCPIGLGFSIDPDFGPSFVKSPGYQFCGEYNKQMLQVALRSPNITSIVLSSRWSNWRIGVPGAADEHPVDIRLRDANGPARSIGDNRQIFARGFERLIQALHSAGKSVWIVGPVPEPATRIPKALYIEHLGFDHTNLAVPKSKFQSKNRWILSFFQKLAKKFPLHILRPDALLCGTTSCPVAQAGHPLFFDDNHLSVYGALMTSSLYDDIFDSTPAVAPHVRDVSRQP